MPHGKRTKVKRLALLERDGPICQICQRPFTETDPPTIDHIIERSRGGSNRLENLRLTHRKCNDFRSNKPGVLAKKYGWHERYRILR